MKTLMDATWAALQALDAGNLVHVRLHLVSMRLDYGLEYIDQKQDAGIVIWRSISAAKASLTTCLTSGTTNS